MSAITSAGMNSSGSSRCCAWSGYFSFLTSTGACPPAAPGHPVPLNRRDRSLLQMRGPPRCRCRDLVLVCGDHRKPVRSRRQRRGAARKSLAAAPVAACSIGMSAGQAAAPGRTASTASSTCSSPTSSSPRPSPGCGTTSRACRDCRLRGTAGHAVPRGKPKPPKPKGARQAVSALRQRDDHQALLAEVYVRHADKDGRCKACFSRFPCATINLLERSPRAVSEGVVRAAARRDPDARG